MSEQRAVPEITPERAAEAVQRLINSHFRSGDRARTRVPASMDDDDLIASSFVSQTAERIATLTAERDALSSVLRQGADAAVDLRTKYEALKLERDSLVQKLADSELAFNHANEVVGKLEADVATHIHDLSHLQDVNNKLMDRVARLSAPVSEREWDSIWHSTARDFANKLIAARTAPAKETE